MVHLVEEIDLREMRIVDQRVEIVERRRGNVDVAQERQPFRRRPCRHDLREQAVRLRIVLCAGGGSRKARVAVELLGLADRGEERFPLPVGIDEHADVAVARAIGAPVRREQARIAGLADRRLVRAPAKVIGQHELGERLEHGQFDRLAFAGAIAFEQRREHDMHRVEADDVIRHGERHVARLLPAHPGEQSRHAGNALDQIVVGGPPGIRPGLAVADQIHAHEARIGGAQVLVGKPEPAHRGRAVVGDE